MKKIKNIVLLSVIFLFVISPPIIANTSVQAILFPATFFFNGEESKLDDTYEILNYQDHTYVPVRFITDSLNAGVEYDANSRNIEIQYPEVQSSKSELVNVREHNDFILAIYSEKETYKTNEFPNIWATLTYIGENETKLSHDAPLIQFGIKDEKGNDIPPAFRLNDTTNFQKYEQFIAQFIPQYLKGYNANVNDVPYEQVSSKFPEGQYTIYVTSLVLSNGEEEWDMSTEIDINIAP